MSITGDGCGGAHTEGRVSVTRIAHTGRKERDKRMTVRGAKMRMSGEKQSDSILQSTPPVMSANLCTHLHKSPKVYNHDHNVTLTLTLVSTWP